MVKTRQQAREQATHQATHHTQSSTKYQCGVQTRSQTKKPHLERVELSNIVLSKEMKKRFQIKKAIAKKSKITQMEKKVRKLVRFRNEYKEHRKQNNEEMLAIWKNMETLFRKL